MQICIRVKGSDPDGCLLLGIPDKAQRDQQIQQPLPWCLGPFTEAKASAMRDAFNAKGGTASTAADCSACTASAKALDLAAPMKLLALGGDPSRALLTRQLTEAEKAGADGAVAKSLELAGPPDAMDAEVLAARTWAAALRSAVADAQATMTRLRSRLRVADKLQWLTAFISAASVTSLIGIIAASDAKAAQIIVAIIGTVAAWATTAAEQLRRNLFGNSRTKQLEELVRAHAEAETVALHLELWTQGPAPRPPLSHDLIDRASALVTAFITARGA